MNVNWKGVFPAITTEFHADQSPDLPATARRLEAMIRTGIHGAVFLGTVGENTALEYRVNAFLRENLALWNLATAGCWEQARELYPWLTPLLHFDTRSKLVQAIKLAMQETGLGSETVRAPRLPLEGAERAEVLAIVRRALATRPPLPAQARA
jgi:dihydrodipicolinate synthase/N-acetylneuraminate lyase